MVVTGWYVEYDLNVHDSDGYGAMTTKVCLITPTDEMSVGCVFRKRKVDERGKCEGII